MSSSRKRQQAQRTVVVASAAKLDSNPQPNRIKAQVPWRKVFSKRMAKWMAGFTLGYVVCCAALFWRYYPDPSEANLKVVEGIPTIYRGGYGRHPSFTIEIAGIKFSCSVSPLRPSRSCPTHLHQSGVPARATFFYAQAITDDRIKNQPVGSPILISLKQSDATVWPQGDGDFFSDYVMHSIVDVSIAYVSLLFLLWIVLSSTTKVTHRGSQQ